MIIHFKQLLGIIGSYLSSFIIKFLIKVKGYGTVKITTPEMATITSDLLSAYRLSQSLSGARPYKYTPNENPGLIFNKICILCV